MDFNDLREMIDNAFAFTSNEKITIYFSEDIEHEILGILYKHEGLITSVGSEIYTNDFRCSLRDGVILENKGDKIHRYDITKTR